MGFISTLLHRVKDDGDDRPLDPVCGMPVEADSLFHRTYNDHVYHFCSSDCLARFVEDPGRYAGANGAAAAKDGE